MTSRIASLALTTAFCFLIVVAIMLNSAALFYMGTALIATVGASRFQAWLAVKALRFERIAPESASIGETVTIGVNVWSERRIRRPLILIEDKLPSRMVVAERTSSLPIAPAFDVPIRTQYKFKPMRRGKFKWTDLTVIGTDALGLVSLEMDYHLAPVEITVLPVPIPIEVLLPPVAGWGAAEAEQGLARGSGLEPRGVREYASGDSMRYVHWRSSARAGKLLVKEFETGSFGSMGFVLQRTTGTDAGTGFQNSFELMVGHTTYLAQKLIRQGAVVEAPTLGLSGAARSPNDAINTLLEVLAEVEVDQSQTVSEELRTAAQSLTPGALVYVLVTVEDPGLPETIRTLRGRGFSFLVLLYNPSRFDSTFVGVPAANGDFSERLRSAGARTVFVNEVGPSL